MIQNIISKTCSVNVRAAQEIRHIYCDRSDEKDHQCVGQMLVDKDGICLACPLCGLDDRRTTPSTVDTKLRGQFILIVKDKK